MRIQSILLVLSLTATLTSCHYKHAPTDRWLPDDPTQVDSVVYLCEYHYWKGTNFRIDGTLRFVNPCPLAPKVIEAKKGDDEIYSGEMIVVEDVVRDTTSTSPLYWVKVSALNEKSLQQAEFADRPHSGWVSHDELQRHVVPDSPVSAVIHALGNSTFKLVLALAALLIALTLAVLIRRRIYRHVPYNGYHALFYAIFVGSVVLHRCIWHFVPETWQEFYFSPTLNPLSPSAPGVICAFVACFWTIIVAALALLGNMWNEKRTFAHFLLSCLFVVCASIVLFGIFAVVVPFHALFAAYPLFLVVLAYVWHKTYHPVYHCGRCGALLHSLGRCPECGAVNR